MFHIQTYTDAHTWYTRAESFLIEREAEHNVIFGLSHLLRYKPEVYADFYLAIVTDDADNIVGVALQTRPHNLILSHFTETSAVKRLAEAMYASISLLPGVTGNPAEVDVFTSIWHKLSGQPYHLEMPQKIYALSKVIPPRPIAGQLRGTTLEDADLLTEWHMGFVRDALHEAPNLNESRLWVERTFEFNQRRLFLWQIDNLPIALVGVTGPTPHGIRIGPVYTPPELRGKGYASAAVAEVSQLLLDEGREFVFLFTDALNPTSNKIYMAIGYEFIAESVVMRFVVG